MWSSMKENVSRLFDSIDSGVAAEEEAEEEEAQEVDTRMESTAGNADEEAERTEDVTMNLEEKPCKHCGLLLTASAYHPKQWTKPRPCCVGCAAELRTADVVDAADVACYDEDVVRLLVRRQLEFYFSEKNWWRDAYLLSIAKEGAVAISALLEFPKMAALLSETEAKAKAELVSSAARESKFLLVDDDAIRRDEDALDARNKRKREEVLAPLVIDAGEEAARKKRMSRFEAPAAAPPPVVSEEEEAPGEWGVVQGTCRSLEKRYLRLTAAPVPCEVRPPSVLREALEHVLARFHRDQDYSYVKEQLKSIRQDCTVQNIDGELACLCYATHARLALAHSDLNEFNQCQTRLRELDDGCLSSADRAEFAAYSLLYALATDASDNQAIERCLLINGEMPRFALSVASACNLENFSALMALRRRAPLLSGFLVDVMLPRLRAAAYARVLVAFAPTIPVEKLRKALGFDDNSACQDYLATHSAVLREQAKDDETSLLLDTRESRRALREQQQDNQQRRQ